MRLGDECSHTVIRLSKEGSAMTKELIEIASGIVQTKASVKGLIVVQIIHSPNRCGLKVDALARRIE